MCSVEFGNLQASTSLTGLFFWQQILKEVENRVIGKTVIKSEERF